MTHSRGLLLSETERQVLADLLDQLEIPLCTCPTTNRPLCIGLYGPQGCTPKCITKKQPDGCPKRIRDGFCHCPKAKCDCPLTPGPPCEHIVARDHPYTCEQWAALLRALDYAAYRDRPRPRAPKPNADDVLTRHARVAIMALRQAKKKGLYHPADYWRNDDVSERDHLGQQLQDSRNGRPVHKGVVRIDGAKKPEAGRAS